LQYSTFLIILRNEQEFEQFDLNPGYQVEHGPSLTKCFALAMFLLFFLFSVVRGVDAVTILLLLLVVVVLLLVVAVVLVVLVVLSSNFCKRIGV